MITVKVKENENVDRALKRFKKKFERSGIMRELRSRTFFEKESVRRRKEVQKARYKQSKKSQD